MTPARFCRVALSGIAVALLAACAGLAVVDEHVEADGIPATDFASDEQKITLSVRFNRKLAADESLTVEWLFPDGKTYVRKPVHRSYNEHDLLETSIPVQGKAPGRHPGIWQVRLWHGGDEVMGRAFEIHEAAPTAEAAAKSFASLAYCGPSRWDDPVITGRRLGAFTSVTPGAWIGGKVLEAAGATYSGVVLLTGCAPG